MLLGALGVGCSGRIVYDEPAHNATIVEAAPDTADKAIDTAPFDVFDDTQDPDAWWRRYPDALHDPIGAPLDGTYPAEGGLYCPGPACFANGLCDSLSGWCCGGHFREGRCVCGATLGCVPPQVCCPRAGATDGVCADLADCPEALE